METNTPYTGFDYVSFNSYWIFKMREVTDNIYLLLIIGMFGSALLVIIFILFNVRNRNRILRHQRKAQEAAIQNQKNLLHATINSQEEERKRIGSDLHDEVGSALSNLRMMIENHTSQPNGSHTSAFAQQSKTMIDNIISNTRNISHDLSPLTGGAYGLIDALEDFCDQLNQAGQLDVSLEFSSEEFIKILPLNHSLALYRVIRELLNNTIKHAAAKTVSIDFSEGDKMVILKYSDDGKGLDQKNIPRGMGMNNIESRLGMIGAAYEILTAPGKGFEIQISIPLK